LLRVAQIMNRPSSCQPRPERDMRRTAGLAGGRGPSGSPSGATAPSSGTARSVSCVPGALGQRLDLLGGRAFMPARDQMAARGIDLDLFDSGPVGNEDVEAVDQPAKLAFELGRENRPVRHPRMRWRAPSTPSFGDEPGAPKPVRRPGRSLRLSEERARFSWEILTGESPAHAQDGAGRGNPHADARLFAPARATGTARSTAAIDAPRAARQWPGQCL
jgi:hypothetical protein